MTLIEDLMEKYFSIGLHQNEIILFLKLIHNISISRSTLARTLRKLNLYRKKKYSKIEDVITFLQTELSKSGEMHGYRWMHLKALQYGLVVSQEIIRELLSLMDPQGVEIRKRKRLRRRQYFNKGPNYLWHMDSYDKLKPYGICINGCLDDYSRHIMWLKASYTSNDSKVMAGYYLDAVKTLGGCLRTIRSDLGTENKQVEKIQNVLRELFETNETQKPPFLYGRSTANQRIESWWSVLRKQNAQYWINLFGMLKDDGYFDGTFLDTCLIQFCFMSIIQNELDRVAMERNAHKIQQSRNSVSPTGRPIIMYEMPSLYGAENYLNEVPNIILDLLEDECTFPQYPCDEDAFNFFEHVMNEYDYHKYDDPYKEVQLYINLRENVKNMLQ